MKRRCSKCLYWIKDEEWGQRIVDKRDMGDCFYYPPKVCQTLIPAVIRTSGYDLLREKQEKYQMRPVTSGTDFCSNFESKKEKQ